METTLQPTDDDDALNALVEQARLFILDMILFIDGVFKRLNGLAPSPKLARTLMRHALIPAEAALRRAILILAADLPEPVIALRPRPFADPARPQPGPAAPSGRDPRPPVFNMCEPQPRPKHDPAPDYLPEHLRPRITLLTDAVLSAAPPPDLAPVIPSTAPPRDIALLFSRRFIALHTAFGDVHAQAARWRRRHAARLIRSQSACAPAPKPPLSPRTLPGLRKSLSDDRKALLRDLTAAAETRLPFNTS